MNQITIVGNVGSDPETTTTTQGIKITKFSIAVTSKSKDVKKTTWFRIVAFKFTAEFAEKYIKKGNKVLAIGPLEIDEYIDKDGNKRNSIQIVAEKLEIMSSNDRIEQPVETSVQNESKSNSFMDSMQSDDLPF